MSETCVYKTEGRSPSARIRSPRPLIAAVMQTEFGSLELVAAKWVLGRIPSEALPRIASDLLDAGPDTPTLRRLAGELHPTLGESGPLFEEILDELGVAVPDMSRAGLVLAKAYAAQFIEGSLSAYDGARHIWEIEMAVEGLTTELGPFVYWASEWEETSNPEERRECEAGIRAAAIEFADAS